MMTSRKSDRRNAEIEPALFELALPASNDLRVHQHLQDTRIAPARSLHAGNDRDHPRWFGYHHARSECGDIARMVSQCRRCPIRGRRRVAFQSLQRRSPGALRDLLAGNHALHQRVHHAATAHGGRPSPWQARARGWRPPQDHAVHAVFNYRTVPLSGLPARKVLRESPGESVPSRHHGYHHPSGIGSGP